MSQFYPCWIAHVAVAVIDGTGLIPLIYRNLLMIGFP